MSRAGYTEDADGDYWALIRWRGAVKSAMRGKRGQSFLVELVESMDALPAPRLIADALEQEGEACAIGSVGRQRGIDMSDLDPYDYESVSRVFGISEALAREIVYENDEYGERDETPEQRFVRMRKWALKHIRNETLVPQDQP